MVRRSRPGRHGVVPASLAALIAMIAGTGCTDHRPTSDVSTTGRRTDVVAPATADVFPSWTAEVPPTETPVPTSTATPYSPLTVSDAPPSGIAAQLSESAFYYRTQLWCRPPDGQRGTPTIGVPPGGSSIGEATA